MHQDLTRQLQPKIRHCLDCAVTGDNRKRLCSLRPLTQNPILPHHDSYADNNLLSRGQEVQADIADKDRMILFSALMSCITG